MVFDPLRLVVATPNFPTELAIAAAYGRSAQRELERRSLTPVTICRV